MAFKPELSVKVSVDPRIDQTEFSNKLQGAVNHLENKPKVELTPDLEKFETAVKTAIKGPYDIPLEPKFDKDLTQAIKNEISTAQENAQELKIKLDVKSFGNDLSKVLKENLRGVNRTLSTYLQEMQKNLALANKATMGLFGGMNRDISIDKIFNEISQKDVSKIQTFTDKLNVIYSEAKKLSSEKFNFKTSIQSTEELQSSLAGLGQELTNLYSVSGGSGAAGDKALKESLHKIDEYRKELIPSIDGLKALLDNTSFIRNTGLKNVKALKEYVSAIEDTIQPIRNLNTRQTSVEDFILPNYLDDIGETQELTIDDITDLGSALIEYSGKIIQSTDKIKEKIKDTIKEGNEEIAAGVPIDPKILEDNTQKIIASIAKVSEAMTPLEQKSEAFSNGLFKSLNSNLENTKIVIDSIKYMLDEFAPDENAKNKHKLKTKQTAQLATGKDNKPQDNAQPDTSNLSPENGTATIKNITFDVDVEKLQEAVNTLFATINAPVGFVPAEGAIQSLKTKLEAGLKEVGVNATLVGGNTDSAEKQDGKKIPLQGQVELSEEDVVPPKKAVTIPGHVTLKKEDITVPETPVDIKATANFVEDELDKAAVPSKSSLKTEDVAVSGDPVDIPGKVTLTKDNVVSPTEPVDIDGKVVLENSDVIPPIQPVDINGKVTLEVDDIKVPDKIDLNGNLVIKNATKEIKAATAEAEKEVSKESEKTSKKDAEKEKQRKKKEYLNDLGSLLKKIATAENKLDEMYPGAENYNELQDYINTSLKRRKSTTESLLTNLVGSTDWQNDSLYTSAIDNSVHIRKAKIADDKVTEEIKNGIREEKEYVSLLKQIPELENAAAKALADFGDKSAHYQDANKKLTDAKNTISAFEQKYGEAYSGLFRSEVVEQQNLSKAMAQERAAREAQLAQEEEANKKRIADEQKYLSLLSQETKDHQTALEVQREYGDKDFRTQYAMEDWQKSNKDLKALESTVEKQSGSLSNVPGYDEVVEKNRRSWMQWGQNQQDISAKQRAAAAKRQASDDKDRATAEKEFLDALSKEPELWHKAEEARKKYGKNSAEANQAQYEYALNHDKVDAFQTQAALSGIDLFDIDGYAEQKQRNALSYASLMSKDKAANVKAGANLISDFNNQLQISVKLLKQLDGIDITKQPAEYAKIQNDLTESIAKTRDLFKDIHDKKLDSSDGYKNAIDAARSLYDVNQERASNQELKDAEDQEKKDIARYKTLLKEKYSYLEKIAGANKNTDVTAWQQIVSDAETEMQTLRSGFKNWFVTDELDLIEQSYKVSANNKANNAKDKEQADYVKDIVSDYKVLIRLQNKRTPLFKPEDSDRLNDIDKAIKRVKQDITDTFANAKNAGFNITGNQDIKEQVNEFNRVRRISNRDFNKGLADYTSRQNANTLEDYNRQLKTTCDLLEEIAGIDQGKEPVRYANAQNELAKSNAETQRLIGDLRSNGLLGSAEFKNINAESAARFKEMREKLTNSANDAAQKEQASYIDSIVKNYGKIEKLQERRTSLFKPEQAKELAKIDDEIKEINKDISKTYAEAGGNGYDLTNSPDIKAAIKSLGATKRASKADFAQNQAQYNSDEWLKNTTDTINKAKKEYIDAFKKIGTLQDELAKTTDAQNQATINQEIAKQRATMKQSGRIINSFNKTANGLVQDAWSEISSVRNLSSIKAQNAYELKAGKEATATKKENLDLLEKYNKALNEELKLYKDLQNADPNKNPEDYVAKQNALNDQKTKVGNLRKDIHNKGLNTSPEYQQYTTRHSEKIAAVDREVSNNAEKSQLDKINAAKKVYLDNHKAMQENLDWLDRIDPNDQNAQSLTKDYQARIAKNTANIKAAGQVLLSYNAAANDAWEEIQSVIDSTNIKNTEAAKKEADALAKKNEKDAKKAASDAKKKESEENTYFRQLQQAVNRRVKAYEEFLEAKTNDPTESTPDYIAKAGRFDLVDSDVGTLISKGTSSGLTNDSRFSSIMEQYVKDTNAVSKANQDRIQAEAEAVKVTEADITAIKKLDEQLDAIKSRLRNAGGTDSNAYADAVTVQAKLQELQALLNAELQKPGSNKDTIAVDWANKNGIDNVKSMDEVVKRLTDDISSLNSAAGQVSSNNSFDRSITKSKTELANLQSQLYDYLKKFPSVSSGMADDVMQLQRTLADPNAYNQVGRLKQSFAELRQQAKDLGLETESLVDKFKNLFGQHLSTMITMAALHKMQDALRVVYQNVVEIDTALTELKKVSELTGKSLEKYMDRAAESAQKLGVSISDYISSTADWKRLGYSDEDAENMATYSTLLKNVGDNIDDVNTSSSYLISTLQGFGLLAKDAEDVVDKIDAVANTQPITAQAIGEILTRSSAAMAAANNNLSETIALGTAAYSVLQNAESTGTMLKSLSMYLRAAKSELEDAGESADGCANSVSELRSELKSLTGVDIMIDNKNFKSTYQIMKELSEVWDNLSDVTKANVTEMIGGKVYPYVQQCA